ncbi:helix-turn-helix transcriptional regulator [Kitasatospora sp. NPDC049285]|uniref:helix-turn-helix domain-containing protein n=1 Tax=Kitasatospora sp. NPDC049285 TaxID=3157096 RepID=UPI003430D31D
MARYPDPTAVISASSLLRRARAGTPDLSQSDLADAAGLGQTALSRYELGKREPTFADLQHIVGRTDYRLEISLRREPHRQSSIEALLSHSAQRFTAADRDLQRLLPAQLAPEELQIRPSEQDGPNLSDALLHYYEIKHLFRDARRLEERLQQTYAQFGTERDRDLIHQMLQVGIGAGQAATALAWAIDTAAASMPKGRGKKEQDEPRLARTLWAHVACCLRAEEAICRDRVERMHQALAAARRREQAANRLRDAEALARAGDRPADDPHVEQARAELDAATRRCAALSPNGGAADVGQAGERYLAVELAELADRACTLFSELAAEPAFARWRSSHATHDPLYDEWLDGTLDVTLAPPKLYPDKDSFYREHPALAQPWRDQLERGEGGPTPYGSDERRARDHRDREWVITIAAPTTGDPRAWPKPEAVVVATRCPSLPTGEPRTPVYVLAANLHATRAADILETAPGPASLASIAAKLTTRRTPGKETSR